MEKNRIGKLEKPALLYLDGYEVYRNRKNSFGKAVCSQASFFRRANTVESTRNP